MMRKRTTPCAAAYPADWLPKYVLPISVETELVAYPGPPPVRTWELSPAMREATVATITGTATGAADTAGGDALRLLNRLTDAEQSLGRAGTALLRTWLARLADTYARAHAL